MRKVEFLSGFFAAAMSVVMLTGCSDDNIGNVRNAVVSPSGDYQAEVVEISYGATGGESVIYVEPAGDGAFPVKGEQNTESSIRIKETRHHWNAQYKLDWLSDSSFNVVAGPDKMDCYLVEMDGTKYSITEGLEIDNTKTELLDKTIDGDTIEITAKIHVKNNMKEPIYFSTCSYVTTKVSSMMTGIMEVQADSDIETGEPLKLDPKESKTFTVKLVGKKNSDEDFINTKPLSVYGWITQIGEQ